MKIESEIKVMNNVTRGYDTIHVDTTCLSTIDLHIPVDSSSTIILELDRKQLIEFLIRTMPSFQFPCKVDAYEDAIPATNP